VDNFVYVLLSSFPAISGRNPGFCNAVVIDHIAYL